MPTSRAPDGLPQRAVAPIAKVLQAAIPSGDIIWLKGMSFQAFFKGWIGEQGTRLAQMLTLDSKQYHVSL